MNPPTLLRKFMSLFWLKKGYFQLAINKTKSGNREKSSRRRRLNIVLGLLLLMKTCWSFWNLLSTSLVGILLKMVMLKLLIVQKLWELLIQIMIERSSIWGRPLWREKGFGGYLRWIMTWTRRMFPSVWKKKKKLKFWFQSSYLQSVPTLLRRHSWHLRLLRNPWNTSCTLSMAASSRWWLVHYWNPREFLQRFKKVVKSQFKIGHEDVNDLMFTGQRVKWIIDEKTKKKSHITVEQSLCVSEPTKVVVPEGLKGEDKCDKDLHTAYRSLLGSINWLQSRTQFQSCCQFSRCASAAASPTIGDCKALNKLCRQIVGDPMELMFWPLQGDPRLVAMPDAAFRNNSDKSSQRAMVIFMAEPGKEKSRNTKGSLIFFESTKIKRTTLSTTVAELYALTKCYGTCQMLRGLIKDITGLSSEIHMRTVANNLVTTASTTHVPEQQETVHMIQMLRKEACSGSIADLSHV